MLFRDLFRLVSSFFFFFKYFLSKHISQAGRRERQHIRAKRCAPISDGRDFSQRRPVENRQTTVFGDENICCRKHSSFDDSRKKINSRSTMFTVFHSFCQETSHPPFSLLHTTSQARKVLLKLGMSTKGMSAKTTFYRSLFSFLRPVICVRTKMSISFWMSIYCV